PELQVGDVLLELLHVGGDAVQRGVVLLRPRHLEQLARVAQRRRDRRERAHGRVERLLLLAEILGALLVAPDVRVGEERLYGLEALLLAFEVKDTSAAQSTWNRGPRAWRRSG